MFYLSPPCLKHFSKPLTAITIQQRVQNNKESKLFLLLASNLLNKTHTLIIVHLTPILLTKVILTIDCRL